MSIAEHLENEWLENGTIYYRYSYKTPEGETFELRASIENVPEASRKKLLVTKSKMSLLLQLLVLDMVRDIE